MIFTLDACALLALVLNEPGGLYVDSLLSDESNTCVVHALNMCEVYYEVLRSKDEYRAKLTVQQLLGAGVTVREDMDTTFWQKVGRFKAEYHRISLADCCCAVLSNRVGGELITSDKELKPLEESKECNVRFFR